MSRASNDFIYGSPLPLYAPTNLDLAAFPDLAPPVLTRVATEQFENSLAFDPFTNDHSFSMHDGSTAEVAKTNHVVSDHFDFPTSTTDTDPMKTTPVKEEESESDEPESSTSNSPSSFNSNSSAVSSSSLKTTHSENTSLWVFDQSWAGSENP